ncbi:MAG: TIGR03032 family protein [Calothrix sp. MO_167.B42]|nr:TIGR03032 family protein [Calothrix sp. MO_167.B42]
MEISSSRQFLEWLIPQHISLVVSTYQTGKIIFLGAEEFCKLSAFQRLFNRAMGLYATTERLYLSCKYQLWQLDNALLPGQVHEGYDKLYVPRIGYTTGDIDIHDVAVDGDGKVVFVSTLLNCLATLSDSHSCKPLWKPPFISRIVGEDRCHLNGLAMVDGKPGYVTACSRSDIVDGWRDRKIGGGVVIDVASNEIICTGLVMPHSPRWYRGKLWLHNSGRGELGYVDLNTGKFEAVTFCPGYLRGLAFWGDYAIVGLSKPRGGDGTFSGLPLDDLLKEKDAEARCGLMVVNLNTGTIAHWVRFEGQITELYDVQIIPGVKHPMALGFQTEEISQLITLEPNEVVSDNKSLNQDNKTETKQQQKQKLTLPQSPFQEEVTQDSKKLLVISKHDDGGFFSNFNKVVQLLGIYSKSKNYDYQVDWRFNGDEDSFRYSDVVGENAWNLFFEDLPFDENYQYSEKIVQNQYLNYSITHVYAHDLYLNKNFYEIRRQYHHIYQQYIKIKPDILEEVDNFFATYMAGSLCLGVHKRHWLHQVEDFSKTAVSVNDYIQVIQELLSQSGAEKIFLATDEEEAVVEMKKAFGNRVICRSDITRASADESQEMHRQAKNSGSRLGREVLIDALLLSKCDLMLHGVSNISTAISFMNPHLEMVYLYVDKQGQTRVFSHSKKLTIEIEKLKVISFSLWGDNPKYTLGAIKNADLAPKIYPGWICRFYVDSTVPQAIIDSLSSRPHVEVIKFAENAGWKASLWRFYPAVDSDVAVMIARDTDSRLNAREKAAVDEWLLSDKKFHIMRDHPGHKYLILGGMWGVKGNGLDMVKLIDDYLQNNSSTDIQYGIDQDFLAAVIYPQVKQRSLVHDEFFEGKPFPVPRKNYQYVGQVFEKDDSTKKIFDDILKQYLLNQKQNNLVNSSVESNSNSPQALLNSSRVFKTESNLEQAEFCLREAIRLKPNYWAAYNNLGTLLQNQENIVEAKQCYEKAIELNPNLAEAISNLASIWLVEEDFERAKTGFYRALQLKPDYIPAHMNLGKIFNKQKRWGAVEHFEKVIALDPNHKEAYSVLAGIYEYHNQFAKALYCYEQLGRLEPDNKYIKAFISNIHFKQCNWEDYNSRMRELIASLESHLANPTDNFLSPFALSALPVSLQQHQDLATAKAKEISLQVAEIKERLQFKFSKNQPKKLRIGYISPDFREHAVGRLIYQIFQHHNRNEFEIYAYHTVDVDNYITQQVRSGCDVFVDISCLSSEDAAKRIYSDGIHILIDLAGYTIDNAEILALQPAPIQAQWLGYPNTMGADFVQYYLGDRILITPEIAQHYTEEIIYLPHAFVASPLPISDKPMIRAEFGLPEDAFVFCCFNAHYKITPQLFDVWMRILEQVPNGVLWLASGSGMENLRSEAKKRGCNPNRLIFAEKIPHDEYLARYRLADLYLDTFIYNAGSTATAVLQSGLPLLTCCGNTNASRMGASICTAAASENTICNSVIEYEQKAVHLATHSSELSQIRLSLQEKLQCQTTYPPLFQVKDFVLTLESAFVQMWQKFVASNYSLPGGRFPIT